MFVIYEHKQAKYKGNSREKESSRRDGRVGKGNFKPDRTLSSNTDRRNFIHRITFKDMY